MGNRIDNNTSIKVIKDRLEIVSDEDINFFGHIQMIKGAGYPIRVEDLERLKQTLPNFAHMIKTGKIKIVK